MTEGQITERRYFEKLAHHLRATGTVVRPFVVDGIGRDPSRLVKFTEGRVEREGDFDAVWCVFDVDTHERLDEAVALALGKGYRVAVSNPSFEVWLIWHFEELTAYHSAQELKRKARMLGASDKMLINGFPYGRYPDAIRRSGRCASPIPDNPGSRVGDLVQMMANGSVKR